MKFNFKEAKVLGYKIPEKLVKEIEEFSLFIQKKLKGEIDPIQFRAKRVPFGIYEQRINDTYMIRVRCPAGIITPEQLEVLANVAKKYGSGRLHITTRQEVQIHSVSDIGKIPEILYTLYEANLSTRGGGGNTVRNIVAPADSGITEDEIFDVSPYAIALTNLLITDDNSWNLPRKFKVNFSYNPEDSGLARIADVGFIAKSKDGQDGFEVYVAGGLGVKSSVAKKLIDFISATEAGIVAEAVKRLFFHHGNRKNRHKARLRFLWDKIGEKEFRTLFENYYNEIKDDKNYILSIEKIDNYCENESIKVFDVSEKEIKDFESWKKRFVFAQRQKDLFAIELPLLLGDIDCDTLAYLADFLKPYGKNIIRFTTKQNILLRNIHRKYLPNFYHLYKEKFSNIPYFSNYLTVCAGADTCKLGLCLSRNLAKVILEKIEPLSLKADGKYIPKIKISGCPNSCGQHWVADIGFYGFAARHGEKLYPAYYVLANYENTKEGFSFAEKVGEIPARVIPDFINNILNVYFENGKEFKEFYETEGKYLIQKMLSDYRVPDFEENSSYYFDWGSEEIFNLSSRSTGECSAGFFDFIERDLAKIYEYRQNLVNAKDKDIVDNLKKLVYFSARMLLITRGIEAEKSSEVFYHFEKNFIDTGYISSLYKPLLFSVLASEEEEIINKKDLIIQLSRDVEKLYDSMDTNFQFHIEEKKEVNESYKETKKVGEIARFKDLRGVACPMNFVKTKLELSFIKSGELLEIYLDEGEPIQNVPGSLKGEGHEIVSIDKKDGYYSVIIKKA